MSVVENLLLMNAVCNGNLYLVINLHFSGTNIHADDDVALRMAAENGHLKVVKYLHSKGANINVLDDYQVIRD